MKDLKKWLLVLCMAGPTVTNFSCTSGMLDVIWQAALDGTATIVQQATTDLLEQTLDLTGAEE